MKQYTLIVLTVMFFSFSGYSISHGPFAFVEYGDYESNEPLKPSFSFGLTYRINIYNVIFEPEILFVPMPRFQHGSEYIDKPFLKKFGVNFLYDFPLKVLNAAPIAGAGLFYINAEHDDLLHDNEELCFGCGDYTTPTTGGYYLTYGIELNKMLTRHVIIIGYLKGNLYGGQGSNIDIHNPAELEKSYLFGVKAGYYFRF
jgi:hypothetical protein